jgi:hypothetical protein
MAAFDEGVLGLPILSRARKNADTRSSTMPNITNAAPPDDPVVYDTQLPRKLWVHVVWDSRIAPDNTMKNATTIPVRLALSAVFIPKALFQDISDAVKTMGGLLSDRRIRVAPGFTDVRSLLMRVLRLTIDSTIDGAICKSPFKRYPRTSSSVQVSVTQFVMANQ